MKPFDKKAELRREQRPRWWLFGIIVILILAISVATVVNVGLLEKTIDKRTNAYMKDVSLEVAKNIDYRLATMTENLTMLEDSLAPVSYTHLDVYKRQTLTGAYGTEWWNKGIQNGIREKAQSRKESETKVKWHVHRGDAMMLSLIHIL